MKTKLFFMLAAIAAITAGGLQKANAQSWNLTGNSDAVDSSKLGTLKNCPLRIYTNKKEQMRITTAGNVGIGITAPLQKLDVKGNINIAAGSGLYIGNYRTIWSDPSNGNFFAGENAGLSTTPGFDGGIDNTASGTVALYSNSNGYENTASGSAALYYNTYGSYNTASGAVALEHNTTGTYNTASGASALFSNTTGYFNTASGEEALFSDTTGYANTASGAAALYYNTTGNFNTASGEGALYNNTTGNSNTALGFEADVKYTNLTNATAIGYGAIVDSSNKVRIGNTTVRSIGGQVGWTTFSDGRYKRNIKEDVQGLKFINLLKPITYTVDINALNTYYEKNRKHDSAYNKMKVAMQASADDAGKILYNGFIAQDVEKAAQSINYNFSGVDKPQTENGLYGLRYADFVVPLVKAVQELSTQNDFKQQQIDSLKQSNQALNNKLTALSDKIDQIQNAMSRCCSSFSSNMQSISSNQSFATTSDAARLDQNTPNPFNQNTIIKYYLPQNTGNAIISITDMNGKVIKTVALTAKGNGQLVVQAGELAAGTYQYALVINGKLIDAKKMVLVK